MKPVEFLGTSRADLKEMPDGVAKVMGFQLQQVQRGQTPECAKVLKGFGGAAVMELKESDASGTFRVVYAARFAEAVYVLHAFQKKSKRGIKTDPADIALIRARFREAEKKHAARKEESK